MTHQHTQAGGTRSGPAKQKETSSGKRTVLIIALIVAVLVLACLCYFGYRFLGPGAPQATSTPTPTTVSPTPTASASATVEPTPTATPRQPTRTPSRAVSPAPTTPTLTLGAEAAPSPTGGDWYQVFFTTPKYPDRPEDRHGGLDENLTAFINTARQTVDLCIYQLDLDNVTQALIAAKSRGAKVRVVTDAKIYEDPKENPSFKQLERAGIKVVAGNPNAIMHDKFVVVDGNTVWTGSWNFTRNDTYRYNNNGILIPSPVLARNYTATFDKMFKDEQFGRKRKPGGTTPRLTVAGHAVENYFAPEDEVAAKIVARLKLARKSVNFMAFSFTDVAIGDTLRQLAQAGVHISGVFETTGSETKYSEFGRLTDARLDVQQDGNPYLMHHKVFIIDAQTVILGSFNFSKNAETENDENLLIIDDAGLAAKFQAEFERVRTQAKGRKP